MHLLGGQGLTIRELEQHIEQDGPQRRQLGNDSMADPSRIRGLRLRAVHSRQQALPAPLAQG